MALTCARCALSPLKNRQRISTGVATLGQRIARSKQRFVRANPYQVPSRADSPIAWSGTARSLLYSTTVIRPLRRGNHAPRSCQRGDLPRPFTLRLAPGADVAGFWGMAVARFAARGTHSPPATGAVGRPGPGAVEPRLIREGSALVQRAVAAARSALHHQAAIAPCTQTQQCQRRLDQIVALYDLLTRAEPSPVIELNRAVRRDARWSRVGSQFDRAILARGDLKITISPMRHGGSLPSTGRNATPVAYERALALPNKGPKAVFGAPA